jgi:hypothetical protein
MSGRLKFKFIFSAVLLVAAISYSRKSWGEDELLDILNGPRSASEPFARSDAESKKTLTELGGILETPTPEQKIFVDFLGNGEFEKALFQWPFAFDRTEFAKTPSGQALKAVVMFKNGIRITALENLLSVDEPKKIDPVVLKLWKEAAPDTSDVWALVPVAQKKWLPFWTEQFGIAAEIRVLSRQAYGVEQIEIIRDLIQKTQVGTRERAWLEWQMVLALAQGSDAGVAGKALAHLMKAPNNPVGTDLLTMTAARLLYQNGFLDAAIKYDEKISKTSDYWFDAQEEIAWAYIRMGQPQNTTAITKTLVSPAFQNLVGPESLFLRSLGLLNVCDYPEVSKTLNVFRDRFKARAKVLLALVETGSSSAVDKFIERSKTKKVSLSDLGSDGAKLPRFITRDEVLAQSIQTQAALEKEAKIASDLFAKGPRLEEFRKSVDSRTESARLETQSRIKTIAKDEVTEITQILQKLHIVEAEVLSRLSLADRNSLATEKMNSAEKNGTTGSQSKDRIWFPAEQETWFDELANYRVDIKKGCRSARK